MSATRRFAAVLSLAATLVVPFASAKAGHHHQKHHHHGHRHHGHHHHQHHGHHVFYPQPVYVTPAYSPVIYPVQTVPTTPAQPTTAALVMKAKQMLKTREYDAAQKAITAALQREPKNSDLMQLKSLISFAQSDYQSAAAAAYSALTLGRSLDWNAIQQLYPSTNEYTLQYRLLSATAKNQPHQPHLQFLLAYHHLMLGHKDAGRAALMAAQEKLPQDKLIPILLSQLPAEASTAAKSASTTVAIDETAPAVK